MRKLLIAATCFLLGLDVFAEDWPEFRGPTGQGHSTASGIPISWSETENVTWKTPIPGRGWSSPVILDNQIWMTTALDDGHKLDAICVDRDSGSIVHNVRVFEVAEPPPVNAKNSHASPTPVLESGRVYVHFGTMGTACLNSASGEILWTNRELVLDHQEGPGSSPILHGEHLIFHCDGRDVQFIVALDKHTGKIAWKTPRSGPYREVTDFRKAFCVPLVIEATGRKQLISPCCADRVISYDPANGRELWKVYHDGFSTVPRPVLGHGLVFIVTGYMKPELWAIRPDGSGDVTGTHVVWKHKNQAPTNPSPLLVDDVLYMVSDQGIASCLEAKTGELVWRERLGDNFSASPVFADGRIYFSSEGGEVTAIAPRRDFEKVATSQIDGRLMASPAIVDSAIFLRSDTHLYRIEK